MKEIKLVDLKLTNFKGVRSLELNADGQDIEVLGKNEAGKTSIFDAFIWLLFDKNSHNQKDFGIKTLVDGEVQHNLNHEVEATLLVDGVDLTLKKVYAEKWTKKRGSATAEHTGHTTDHFVNGVPCNKTEFTKKIAEIVSEDVFKLLTSPSYFNEQLHWTKRRDILLEIAGDISNEDVIAESDNLVSLTALLENYSIDDLKKMIASKRKEINKQLDDIPIRIDEIHRNKADVGALPKEEVNTRILELDGVIETKNDNLNDLRNGSEVNKIKKELSDVELKLSQVKNRHEQDNLADVYKLKSRLQEEQSNLSILKSKATNEMQRATDVEYRINVIKEDMSLLRAEWSEINAKELQHEDKCECPTCKQPLPQDEVDQAREKAESDFNAWKSTELESIQKQGVSNKERVATLEQELESINKNVEKIKSQIYKKEKVVAKLEKELADKQEKATPIEENEDFNALKLQQLELNNKIERISESIESEVEKAKAEINALIQERNEYQAKQSTLEQREKDAERIAELEAEQKELAKAFEEQEALLFATEEFARKKVELLEDKINSKFKHARFKLFEDLINGGLQETCETTYKGVPYTKDLNDGAKINVGLDIIDTLSKHYGVQAPIFIDNAESVTEFFSDIDSQVIKLIASKDAKTLRIEQNENV